MASFHNWTGDELIDIQVPQFLNEDNAATQEKLDTKFNNSLKITGAADLNNFKDEGFYYCNSNSQAETILNCPTNYAFGLMVWGKEDIFYQEVREFNRGFNQDYNNCWRRSYYFDGGQGVWSNWQKMSYAATTLAGYGITDGMNKNDTNSVSVADILKRNINTSYLRLTGGNTFDKGANLQLCGGTYAANAGQFLLNATDSTQSATLLGSPSGLLKWKNKNIVRSINNIVADENGNVSIDVSSGGGGGGVSTSESNTWTGKQTFQKMKFNFESYNAPRISGTIDNPSSSVAVYNVQGNFTLDMSVLAGLLSNSDATLFTAYITANGAYTLSITNAGTLKYVGNASDLAITINGLLLNILLIKSSSGDLSSVVQASALS